MAKLKSKVGPMSLVSLLREVRKAESESKPIAVIAASSYDNLVSDINFIGSLADRPQLGQMLEGSIALFTQGKGLAGIDKTKPWGVFLLSAGDMGVTPVGCVAVTDKDGKLAGVITDGDLRRHMRVDLLQAQVDAVMTASPKTVRPDQLASEALQILNSSKITALRPASPRTLSLPSRARI